MICYIKVKAIYINKDIITNKILNKGLLMENKDIIINNTNSWKKDKNDIRDKKYSSSWKIKYFPRFKEGVDLRDKLSEVENQKNLNSCTANAIATSIEMNNGYKDISRLFLYYESRIKSNEPLKDDGAYLRDVLKIAKIGVCEETLWQYLEYNVNVKPNIQSYNNRLYKINSYTRLSDNPKEKEKQIYHALDTNKVIVFGTIIFKSFMNLNEGYYERKPFVNDPIMGYHAVALVGYEKNKSVIVRNSWGKDWGEEGYCYFPINYVIDRNYNDDFWVIE